MASPEAMAFFSAFKQQDPESKTCFECKSSNPQWCDVWHGIYICLECSGVHRSLGTHLSFVRSCSMDGWPDDKMNKMKVGGNGKAKAFFQKHGIMNLQIREKYNTDPALMYKDKIAAEAEGKPFNEAAWKPPPKQQTYVSQAQNTARPEPGFGGSKYEGIGAPTNRGNQNSDVIGDASAMFKSGWASLSTGVSKAAEVASKAAADAAAVAAAKSKELSDNAAKVNVSDKAGESWTKLAASTKSGWGSLTSWAKAMTGEEEGLDDALKNLDLKKGSAFDSLSSEQNTQQQPARQQTPPPSSTPKSPVNPAPKQQNSSGGNDWDWKDEEDGWGGDNAKQGTPTSGGSTNSKSGGGGGASLSSLKRKPAGGGNGKKAE